MRHERTATRLVFAGLAIFYAVLGLVILSSDAVYSGDIAIKFVQARALAAHRFTSLDIPYPGAFLDPERRFLPMRPPFFMTVGQQTHAIYPTPPALIQAAAVTAGGVRGMVVVTVLAGLVIMYATAKLAEPPLRPFVLLAAGLAGPLWFFVISGWEHAPAIAFGAAAFLCAMRVRGRKAPLLAGLLLGLGATQREEMLLLTPGLLMVLWMRMRAWRPLMTAGAAAAAVVVAAACVDIWWFGRPPAVHLRVAVHMLQGSWVADEPGTEVPSLKTFTQRDRYQTVIQYWLFGYGNDRIIALYVAGLAAALLLWRLRRSSTGILVWVCAIAALAVVDLREVVTAPKWLAGMLRVSPFFVFALLPYPIGAERSTWMRVAALFTTGTYLTLAYLGADTTGGKSLGPRLLLPLFPLLAVASIESIRDYLRAPGRTDRWIGWLGALLVAIAVAIHVGGTIPAYVERNHDDAEAITAVASSPERIVVSDDVFTAQLLMPLYYRKILFLADTLDLATRLGAKMDEQRVPGVMLVARGASPRVALAPLRLAAIEIKGRFVIQHWQR
jgi:hypothetical protein